MKLYRSINVENANFKRDYNFRDTMRPPGNIPYIVDNLWEWKRPEEFPNRRFSAYTSPNPELALKLGPENGTIFEIQFTGVYKIAQLTQYTDSKFHPECKTLKNKIINLLKQETGEWWLNWDNKKKQKISPLWMPCLRKNEVEDLFNTVPYLQSIKKQVKSFIAYWDNVNLVDFGEGILSDLEGEIFFEARGGYRLVDLSCY